MVGPAKESLGLVVAMENLEPKIEQREKLRDATLVFLVKKTDQEIADICLAMKKRGFGAGRWNGVGGKVEVGEEIIDAATRETKEEIGVSVEQIKKVGELSFFFPHNPAWNQKVHVYFSEHWLEEPSESEEMKPHWFSIDQIPFDEMWADDEFWLPEVLAGKLVRADFVFGEGDVVLEKQVRMVENF